MHNEQLVSITIQLTRHVCARLSRECDTTDHICIAIIAHISSPNLTIITTHPLPDNISVCLFYQTAPLSVASQSPGENNTFILKSKVVDINMNHCSGAQ